MSALVTCNCCRGLEALTPVEIANPPGLGAVAYRAGTYATFRESMLAALATRSPALDALDPYSETDFATALVDAWAVTCDVLTFYEERIANEAWLRTATERRSIIELARAIGYELKPGLAASAWLAFTVEEPPPLAAPLPPGTNIGAPQRGAVVEPRTKVQSVPGPGETARIFETVERIEAWPEWNAIRPLRRTAPRPTVRLAVAGRADVKEGDRLLLNDAVKLAGPVSYDAVNDVTLIGVGDDAEPSSPDLAPGPPASLTGSLSLLRFVFGFTEVQLIALNTVRVEEVVTLAEERGLPLDTLAEQIRLAAQVRFDPTLLAFRLRAGIFGHNAPEWGTLPKELRVADPPAAPAPIFATEWKDDNMLVGEGNNGIVDLDSRYPTIAAGSRIILEDGTTRTAHTVTSVGEATRSKFALTAKVTHLAVSPAHGAPKIRSTTVYAESVPLPITLEPNEPPVAGDRIALDGVFLRLRKGQHVIVTGTRDDARTLTASEVREIAEVLLDHGVTKIRFTRPLDRRYVRRTVIINANVAAATDGETVAEVMGNGDAAQAYPAFPLRQKPLTFTAAATASGVASTLEVFVNDVRWREVPSLLGHGPKEHIYTTRRADDATTTVRFGDGITGARLPTGEQNVRAMYRKGLGPEGLLRTDQLSLLMDRPHGIKGVTNPLPTADAAAPESRDDARTNAPLTVLTLDRIVSLRDFEDFARAFAGVAKALATVVRGEPRHGVFITVAGPDGAQLADTSRLETAIRSLGDPFVNFTIRNYRKVFFSVSALVTVGADRIPEVMRRDIERLLRARFAFDRRSFGQPVTRGEIIAAIQGVDGVVSVVADLKDADGTAQDAIPAALPPFDPAAGAPGADLLLLDSAPLDLRITT
jgi:predicted phage baseplate assembly protein